MDPAYSLDRRPQDAADEADLGGADDLRMARRDAAGGTMLLMK
jgi:hypothetical protein